MRSSATNSVPLQNIEVEESVLGAMLVAQGALTRVIDEVKLKSDDFYLDRHQVIFSRVHDLYAASKPVDELSVTEALTQHGQIDEAGGKHYVSELAAKVPAAGNAKHYAEIVRENADGRRLIAGAQDMLEMAQARNGDTPDGLHQRMSKRFEGIMPRGADAQVLPEVDRWTDGGAFILDSPEKPPSVWGGDDEVLWPEGEPLMIAAPPGLGKTTVGQQLTLALAGIGDANFLGFRVRPATGKAGYLAADRPAQSARSFRRMVDQGDRPTLAERLDIWRGPLPFDLAKDPSRFAPFLKSRGISNVIIDSLGAVGFDLASDEAGSRVFNALGEATAEGIDVGVLHHDRKREQGTDRVRTLDDVYGSRWLTAAMGSVLYLDGKAGDLVVKLRHLKQPATEVGPLTIRHDHEAGRSVIHESTDLLDLAAEKITVKQTASVLYEVSDPSPNEIEKARRRLDKLADRGDLVRSGDLGEPTVYRRAE